MQNSSSGPMFGARNAGKWSDDTFYDFSPSATRTAERSLYLADADDAIPACVPPAGHPLAAVAALWDADAFADLIAEFDDDGPALDACDCPVLGDSFDPEDCQWGFSVRSGFIGWPASTSVLAA